MSTIETLLKGGDPRSLRGVTRVIDDVLHDPAQLDELIRLLEHDTAIVRMRAADAVEKISRTNPEYLEAHRAFLLGLAASTEQASLRWHLAQTIPRLALETRERRSMIAVFQRYLDDSSAIVKTSAMQAITEFAVVDPALRRTVVPLLRKLIATGSAAMRVRGGRLLEILEQRTGRKAR